MEALKQLLTQLVIRYNNGLDYIRNNPNLTQEEVREHYDNLKTMRVVQKQLEGLCE